jgi:hypothetical protein
MHRCSARADARCGYLIAMDAPPPLLTAYAGGMTKHQETCKDLLFRNVSRCMQAPSGTGLVSICSYTHTCEISCATPVHFWDQWWLSCQVRHHVSGCAAVQQMLPNLGYHCVTGYVPTELIHIVHCGCKG